MKIWYLIILVNEYTNYVKINYNVCVLTVLGCNIIFSLLIRYYLLTFITTLYVVNYYKLNDLEQSKR